jgi:PKD repeat protein
MPSSVICGGGTGGVSACNGDSGGPFAVRVGNDFYSIGTVSWGIACSGATAFTRTSSYIDWIKTKTGIGSDTGNDSAPTANFTYTAQDLTVSFSNASSDDKGIASYAWNFGDTLTSSAQNPVHSYQQAGSYNVTLKVTDTSGQSHTTSKLVKVDDGTTLPGCSGTAEWTASRSYSLNDEVSFKGRKYQAVWWSTGAQPDVYTNVWKDIGSCDDGSTGDKPPVADFGYQINGLSVNFVNNSNDDVGISSVNWSFGDGTTSQSFAPSHTYAAAGTYTVSLSVTDTQGQSKQVSKSITVADTSNTCQTPAWSSSKVYQTGDKASVKGKVYQAKWWVQGENPELSGPWGPWTLVGQCN